jgi:hypothetical protein
VEIAKLAKQETEEAYFVVVDDDPEDWLVRFEKSSDFPAREWADNMIRLFNARHGDDAPAGPDA